MAKNWFARMYETGELVSSTCYQPFVLNKSISLKALRLTIIKHGSPTLTGLQAHIYTTRAGAPSGLVCSSINTWDLADITSFAYGARQIYFEFDPRHLNGSDTYAVVLTATSYTGDDTDHIAWKLNFPDYLYSNTTTNQVRYLGIFPQEVIFIGADL